MTLSENLPSQAIILDAMLKVLRDSKDGMHIKNIESEVANLLSLSESQLALMHKGKRTMLGYKLAWARTAAKKQGLIESPMHSVWKVSN